MLGSGSNNPDLVWEQLTSEWPRFSDRNRCHQFSILVE